MERWPHQKSGLIDINAAIQAGEQRIVWASTTGTGKSKVMEDLSHAWVDASIPVVAITNRKFLFEQLVTGFRRSGLAVRTIASGWPDHGRERFTACMYQTLNSRGLAPPAKRVLFDECHNETGPGCEALLNAYVNNGAVIIGFTASPLGLNHIYNHLIMGADRSDGRECGAIVLAQCFGGGQLDCKDVGREVTGEFKVGEVIRKVWNQSVYGHVVREYLKINPTRRPTILFAPGKKEASFFVDEFEREGISAASITSDGIYWGGETIPATPTNRELLKVGVVNGSIKVLCNRFILREGIDIPELSHCILACPFGSILSYTQSVGRVGRYHHSMPWIDFGIYGGVQQGVTVQDHGGNFWRHGSPNADLAGIWKAYFDSSVHKVMDDREESFIQKARERPDGEEAEGFDELPSECPVCGALQFYFKNRRCYKCDSEIYKSGVRRVIQSDGQLKELHAMHDMGRKRRLKDPSSEQEQAWKRAYFMAWHTGRTFGEARAYVTSGRVPGFEHLRNCDLPWDLPYMPKHRKHWKSAVNQVEEIYRESTTKNT